MTAAQGSRSGSIAFVSALVALPLLGLGVLLGYPELDVRWEHHPSHFWIVLVPATLNAALAYATGEAARRRGDARTFLVSLGFMVAGGFLFLHALATPGVLLDAPNTGFTVATPVGLAIAAPLFAGSALVDRGGSSAVMRVGTVLRVLIVILIAGWATASLAELFPLDLTPPRPNAPVLLALGGIGAIGFGTSAVVYVTRHLKRPSKLVAAVGSASVLLAEAMLAIVVARNWHTSWWLWHVLILLAFTIVALVARTQWREEPFADLYLDHTASGKREVSIVYADLEGFTSFSERHDATEVATMLNAFFAVAVPAVVRKTAGNVDNLVGDAIMVTFNGRGDQPDHAERALRAALELRDSAATLASEHPDWPRLRIGVNSGDVVVGLVGAEGGRRYTVIGDAVNVAARLEASAPAGEVVVGEATVHRVPGAVVQAIAPVVAKGKREPVRAFLLKGVD